jgi:hypothetical protein
MHESAASVLPRYDNGEALRFQRRYTGVAALEARRAHYSTTHQGVHHFSLYWPAPELRSQFDFHIQWITLTIAQAYSTKHGTS